MTWAVWPRREADYMIPTKVDESLHRLAQALGDSPNLGFVLRRFVDTGSAEDARELGPELRADVDVVDKGLPPLTRSAQPQERLGPVLGDHRAPVLVHWLHGATGRAEVRMAPILALALQQPEFAEEARLLARRRLIQGPLLDGLACLPLLGSAEVLSHHENSEARARLEILIWDAGASALTIPELGAYVWSSKAAFEELIGEPSRGSLRGRVLAARCFELSIAGMPANVNPRLLGESQLVLQPLLLHPESLVHTHAARALGLFAGKVEALEGTLLDWIGSSSLVLRQRAMTAFASLPAARLRVLGHELGNALALPGADDWALPAAAAGTPYLLQESRERYDDVAGRILSGRGGATAARELARGLGVLYRGGLKRSLAEPHLIELRQMARRASADSIEEWRSWLSVLSATDPVDGAERDPLDLEIGLENLMHQAAKYDDEEADARTARFAESVHRTFAEAQRVALGSGSLRHRAAGFNALEGCARSMALRLWAPQLATHPGRSAIPMPDMTASWQLVADAPTELIDVIRERRELREGQTDGAAPVGTPRDDEALEVLAVRLGGYALDACDSDASLGPGRGPTANQTCRWVRKLDGVADGSRDLPPALREALSSIFWRLVDTTRGTALGEVDDVAWLGPFAAWWALVIDRPAMLQQLATALPMIREGVLDRCCDLAETIRTLVASGRPNGEWGREVVAALESLNATGTELEISLSHLATTLSDFAAVSGRSEDIESKCTRLVLSAERLQAALLDPVKALHPAVGSASDSLPPVSVENAPRIAALVTRAIRARETGILDVWFTSLGPVASALVEGAVSGAVQRTPPPPPSRKKVEPEVIEGYELVKPLGEGGVGKVYLVRKPGADRLFVLKIPKREALAGASETEKKGLLDSFIEEANALAHLYHPNVANIIDRGVVGDVPFLVLELLIGCDLSQYSKARLCTLFEMRQIVLDACSGLASLHGARLVHRDIKPANLWLRLPLASGERFDPELHRDPARVRPLSTVVIDFGMVRPTRVAPDAGGRFVAGTPGYIAPDQVLDPVELDPRADVYALAATIYNVTTGRAFFDEITTPRDRIFAHMQREPLEDVSLIKGYPAELVKLMRAATALDPKDRPFPLDFGRAFEACL